MKAWVKKAWVKWVLAAGVLILSVPLLLTLFIDQEHYKQQLSDAVEASTGRPLVIDGALKLAIGWKSGFHAESIRYPNAPWGSRPWAIEVDKATFVVDLWALLRGKLLVEDIILERPRVWVEHNPAGVFNLEVLQPRSGEARTALPWGLEVSGASVIDGEIAFATRNRHWDIHIHNARAESGGPGKPVVVDFRGEVEETPIVASAKLGSLETLFTYQPSPVSAVGWVGTDDNPVRAEGRAGDLLKWRDIDLQLDFEVAQVAELSGLAGTPLPDIGTVSGHARLLQSDWFSTMTLRDIELQSAEWGLRSTLSGEITEVYQRRGIDLNFSAAGAIEHPLVARLTRFAGQINPANPTKPANSAVPLNAEVTARLHGSAQKLRFQVKTAKIENADLVIDARGAVDFIDGEWSGSLPVSFTLKNGAPAALSGKTRSGKTLPPLGPLTAEAELTRAQESWRLNDVKMSVAREALSVKVAGVVNDLTAEPSGHLYVIAEADDGRYLQPFFAEHMTLPPMSGLKLEAAVGFSDDTVRATVDKLSGRVYGVDLSASGDIAVIDTSDASDASDKIRRLRGVDLKVSGRADGLQQLPPVAGRALPRSGPVRVEARLGDDESGAFHLTDITASVTGAPIELAARGAIRNLGAAMDTDLAVELTLSDAGPVQALFADSKSAAFLAGLPQAVVPLKATGKLRSRGKDWTLEDIKVVSEAAQVKAELAGEITAFAPLDARFHLDIDKLPTSGLPASWNVPRLADGNLDISLDLTVRQFAVGVKNIAANLDSADAKLGLHGDIDRLNPIAINKLKLEFEAASVAALAWPLAAGFIPDNPVSASVTVQATGVHSSHFSVDAKVGANDLHGSFVWDRPKNWQGPGKGVSRVKAELVSERLNLAEILTPPAEKKSQFFSRVPINADWMHNFNGRIDLTAGEAGDHRMNMHDVRAWLVLDEGKLQQTVVGRMGQGELAMRFAIDAHARPFSAEFKLNGKQLDTAGLVVFREDNSIDNGTFHSAIEITTEGLSVADFAANANGRASFRLNGARMKNQSLDFIGGDIFSNLVTLFNPFRAIGEYVDIECSVMEFDIEKGVATSKNGLAMKTDKVTLLGGGYIDLGDESLKILISPKARKGFGINASSLAKIVRVGGTLSKPEIEADSSRLLETGATVWGALYTGGLTLFLKGLFDLNHANADVCGLAGGAQVKERDITAKSLEVR